MKTRKGPFRWYPRNIPRGLLAARATTGLARIVQWSFNRPCEQTIAPTRSRQRVRPELANRRGASARLPRKRAPRGKRSGEHLIGRAVAGRRRRRRVPQYATRFQRNEGQTIDRKREIGKSPHRLKTVRSPDKGATIDHASRMSALYTVDRLPKQDRRNFWNENRRGGGITKEILNYEGRCQWRKELSLRESERENVGNLLGNTK